MLEIRLCFITSEVFSGERRGGLGKLVHVVGRELARRGFDVHIIVWDEENKQRTLELDNMIIHTYPYTWTSSSTFRHLRDYTKVMPVIRRVNADVYISIECMVETLIAEKIMPRAKHVIWAQDPFDENDYRLLGSIDPHYRFNKEKFWVTTKLYAEAYRKADLVLAQARYYIPKIAKLYGINPNKIIYLPNPLERIPDESSITKSEKPLISFLGRMDPQKRYWLFFELAKNFPEAEFIAMGKPGPLYRELYERITRRYQGLKNLKIVGFVSEEKKSAILANSWIVCLPSIREGLPISFLEALAHKCGLLSSVNPDNLVSRFGLWVRDGKFKLGLKKMLDDNLWKRKAEAGYRYVKKVNNIDKIITKFIDILTRITIKG